MINRVTLQGNVGRAPKFSRMQDGRERANFYLATTQTWRDKSGEWQSCTDWHPITVFRESTVRWMKEMLAQGDKVLLEGKLTYEQWTDPYGHYRTKPHVVIAGPGDRLERLQQCRQKAKISESPLEESLESVPPSGPPDVSELPHELSGPSPERLEETNSFLSPDPQSQGDPYAQS